MDKKTHMIRYTLINIKSQTKHFKKPRQQRPIKWNKEYQKEWIKFLEISRNSIHHFIISDINGRNYLIDGGNRYDTIIRFCEHPFKVMDNYLKEIRNSLNDKNIENIDIILNYLEIQELNDLLFINTVGNLKKFLETRDEDIDDDDINLNQNDVNTCFTILKPYLDKLRILSNI